MKHTYEMMNEHITPDPCLNDQVLEQVTFKPKRSFRPLAAMAAILALILAATPVMAAYVPPIAELMYQVSPEMAARFSLVQKSDTENGIQMEVVSASIHGATAEVCISFEDLEGDRISEDLRVDGEDLLGKSVFLSGNWGSSIGNFSYDPKTGKAIMVLDYSFSFYSDLRGRYLTVDELFGGKITVKVDSLYWYTEDGGTETVAGPWRVTFKIDESNYVGEHDDGVPETTHFTSE